MSGLDSGLPPWRGHRVSPSVRTHRALHGSLDPRLPLHWLWRPHMPAAHLRSSGPSMLESLHVALPVDNTVAAASATPEQPSAGYTGSCSRHRRPESRPARRCPPRAHSVQGAEPAFLLSVRHVPYEGETGRWMWLPHRFLLPPLGRCPRQRARHCLMSSDVASPPSHIWRLVLVP